MKAADAASFAASWWPYASFETLRIATYLSIWVCISVDFSFIALVCLPEVKLFTWDDGTTPSIIDSREY